MLALCHTLACVRAQVNDQRDWMEPFLQHTQVDYLHTSGGRTTASSARVRAHEPGNLVTWAELHRVRPALARAAAMRGQSVRSLGPSACVGRGSSPPERLGLLHRRAIPLSQVSGRGIIADTGYGVGGKLTPERSFDNAWADADNLRCDARADPTCPPLSPAPPRDSAATRRHPSEVRCDA